MIELAKNRPLDATQVAILRETQACAKQVGTALFLIGASARVLLLEHVFGLPKSRATRDIDFAVAVDSWQAFEELKIALIQTGSFSPKADVSHRLHYQKSPNSWIDIVPYGGIENEAALITWPGKDGKAMNVAGFKEAFESAAQVKIDENTSIAVVSLPGLMLLKLNAWLDRETPAKQLSDAQDMALLLKHYERAGVEERIYAANTLLAHYGYDNKLAGAWLLGFDAGLLCAGSPRLRETLNQLFQTQRREQLVQQIASEFSSNNPLAEARTLFKCFEDGFLV